MGWRSWAEGDGLKNVGWRRWAEEAGLKEMGWRMWAEEAGLKKLGWRRWTEEDGLKKTSWRRRGEEAGLKKMGWRSWAEKAAGNRIAISLFRIHSLVEIPIEICTNSFMRLSVVLRSLFLSFSYKTSVTLSTMFVSCSALYYCHIGYCNYVIFGTVSLTYSTILL